MFGAYMSRSKSLWFSVLGLGLGFSVEALKSICIRCIHVEVDEFMV